VRGLATVVPCLAGHQRHERPRSGWPAGARVGRNQSMYFSGPLPVNT
jgi:hypothetical protein